MYFANSLGGAAGVLASGFLLIPWLGLPGTIASAGAVDLAIAALVDVLLGATLLVVCGGRARALRAGMAVAASAAGVAAVAASFDPQKLTSGVFRTGHPVSKATVIEIAHGKTATASVEREGDSASIRTNGKPDASANVRVPVNYMPDEVTVTLLGAVPLMLHPDPRRVANIGMGSGITGQVILDDSRVRQLDTIEIEPLATPSSLSINRHFGPEPLWLAARQVKEIMFGPDCRPGILTIPGGLPENLANQGIGILNQCAEPPPGDSPYAAARLGIRVLAYLSPTEGGAVLAGLGTTACLTALCGAQMQWPELLRHIANRDASGFGRLADRLLQDGQGATEVKARYLLGIAMLGRGPALSDPGQARATPGMADRCRRRGGTLPRVRVGARRVGRGPPSCGREASQTLWRSPAWRSISCSATHGPRSCCRARASCCSA